MSYYDDGRLTVDDLTGMARFGSLSLDNGAAVQRCRNGAWAVWGPAADADDGSPPAVCEEPEDVLMVAQPKAVPDSARATAAPDVPPTLTRVGFGQRTS